jgi:hypothetical protein
MRRIEVSIRSEAKERDTEKRCWRTRARVPALRHQQKGSSRKRLYEYYFICPSSQTHFAMLSFGTTVEFAELCGQWFPKASTILCSINEEKIGPYATLHGHESISARSDDSPGTSGRSILDIEA